MLKNKKLVIFSDFDGTITERDVIVMIMEKFAPPEWEEIKDNVLYKRTMTLKDGIEALFGLIDSEKRNDIISFAKKDARIRKGFEEFLDFCNLNGIQFNVQTAGLDFFVGPLLEKYRSKLKMFCNKANFTKDKITIDYKYLPKDCSVCGGCGLCKVEIVESYPKEKYTRVVIGDGLADLPPARIADLVFATGNLVKLLKQENQQPISYIQFNDFYEVKAKLQQELLLKI